MVDAPAMHDPVGQADTAPLRSRGGIGGEADDVGLPAGHPAQRDRPGGCCHGDGGGGVTLGAAGSAQQPGGNVRGREAAAIGVGAARVPTGADLGTQQVDAKIDGDDRLTRIFPSFPDMGTTTYYRCKR